MDDGVSDALMGSLVEDSIGIAKETELKEPKSKAEGNCQRNSRFDGCGAAFPMDRERLAQR